MKVIGIAAMVLLAAGAAFEGLFNAAQQPPVTTIEEAKVESVRIQRELVELNDGLAALPQESQTAPIGETTLTLARCERKNFYYYPGITSVAFNDAASVVEFHDRINQHLLTEGWTETERHSSEKELTPEFSNSNGFKVFIIPHQEPDNLRVVIHVYSSCVELPPDFPKAGGPKY